MKMVDVNSSVEKEGDLHTLIIKVTGLTLAEADTIGDSIERPLLKVVADVISEDGSHTVHMRDLKEPTQ